MTPNQTAKLFSFLMMPLMIGVVLVESLVISRGVKKLVRERHPDLTTSGVGMYASMRAMQMRRMRMPKARRTPGEQHLV